MYIKSIKLKNFKCFKDSFFDFAKINLIVGDNGVGKSSLSVDSILFTLFGYSSVSLSDLPYKGAKNRSCKVTIELKDFVIAREYPTKINIIPTDKNYPPFVFANNLEAQKWLNEKFKNVDYFRRMRMIDTSKGINILEESKSVLRKILLSFYEDIFNRARQILLEKKREREIWNRDNLNTYSLYPSEKRFNFLNTKILEITEQIYNYEREIKELEEQELKLINKKNRIEIQKENLNSQKYQLLERVFCPTCKQKIKRSQKEQLISEISKNISNLNSQLTLILEELTNHREILVYIKELKRKLEIKKEKAFEYKCKLEQRLSIKNYKYTQKDVEVIKKAIEKLDSFSTQYITYFLKKLEPIINSIINKINFQLSFEYNKNSIDIKLFKNNEVFSYRELSSGQKLILSIAFQLALLIERGEEGLIICDEGMSNLDENNLEMILDLFKELPFQLILVAHRFTPNSIGNINIINLNERRS